MPAGEVVIKLSREEALVLFDWLARVDDAKSAPIEHPAEQKLLWILEGQLEKNLPVFAANCKTLVDAARLTVDQSR